MCVYCLDFKLILTNNTYVFNVYRYCKIPVYIYISSFMYLYTRDKDYENLFTYLNDCALY